MDILILSDGTRYEVAEASSIAKIGINITWNQFPDVIEHFNEDNLAKVQIITNGSVSTSYTDLALKSASPPNAGGTAYFELTDARKKMMSELAEEAERAKNQASEAKAAQLATEQLAASYEDGYKAAKYLMGEEE